MSLPIAAVGPLNVETNPILMESAAMAEFASARAVAPASQNAVLISVFLPRYFFVPPVDRPAPFGERLALRPRVSLFFFLRCRVLCAKWQVGSKHEPPAAP